MDDLIRVFAPALVDALLPVIMVALTTFASMVMNELRKKFRGEAAQQLLVHVENVAQMAVLEIEQTIAPQIKAALADDGKISAEEASGMRIKAIARAKVLLGAKGVARLKAEHGSVDMVIGSAVEAQVRVAKIRSNGPLMRVAPAGNPPA